MLFSCSHLQVTILICATSEGKKIEIRSFAPQSEKFEMKFAYRAKYLKI